ncbi:hypothetical protein NO559_07895 [Dasania sp. GY-MA-18]|uniref:Uncharacterized protein n=1 Tax=Dasania phycosphaerae TaxID=2950436 RepID=A0A9J6RK94_9GAMM|nr:MULTISPECIES: hypothetical protein [Dasania]MCR8922688.1 hypothetical protein [Dasania sp. GY-MA-18]MCZ0865118.1 hypothetical protein [Dasania phycosphaerae]MCZ0868844.1 hypothetical protein [Dasania phycosphaerae]
MINPGTIIALLLLAGFLMLLAQLTQRNHEGNTMTIYKNTDATAGVRTVGEMIEVLEGLNPDTPLKTGFGDSVTMQVWHDYDSGAECFLEITEEQMDMFGGVEVTAPSDEDTVCLVDD